MGVKNTFVAYFDKNRKSIFSFIKNIKFCLQTAIFEFQSNIVLIKRSQVIFLDAKEVKTKQ